MSDAAAAAADPTQPPGTGTPPPTDPTPGKPPTDPAPAAPDDGASGEPAPSNVVWPEKWREEWATQNGADEEVTAQRLQRLNRWDHPSKLFDSYLEVEKTLKNADIRTPFPEEGNDKDKVAWRKENGIPAEAAGYLEKLPKGLDVASEDLAGMAVLTEAMHKVNSSVRSVHAAMSAYDQHVKNVLADQAEADAKGQEAREDELQAFYGPDTRRNLNDLGDWIDAGGKNLKDKILSSRMPDGTPLGNDPDYLKFMIGVMRKDTPLQTIEGLGTGDPLMAMTAEIAKIEDRIRTDNSGYRGDVKMQARYLELLAAREKSK